MGVEAFLPEVAVERLDERVVGRLPRTGVKCRDQESARLAPSVLPTIQVFANEYSCLQAGTIASTPAYLPDLGSQRQQVIS